MSVMFPLRKEYNITQRESQVNLKIIFQDQTEDGLGIKIICAPE